MTLTSNATNEGFRHEALLYEGAEDLVARCKAFIEESLESGEPIMVAVTAPKIEALRAALGPEADRVRFVDMSALGRNPMRIIAAWRRFAAVEGANGRRIRGIGEPIWAARSADEIAEAERHEALLNLALAGVLSWIVCPYDVTTLDRSILDEAHRTHPLVCDAAGTRQSDAYAGSRGVPTEQELPLTTPPASAPELAFATGDLARVRDFVGGFAARQGASPDVQATLVFAANELAANSMRHAGGRGTVRVWIDGPELVCEVRDAGRITDDLVGRVQPIDGENAGLWLVNELCDFVQLRSSGEGSVVRVRVSLNA